MSGEIDWKQKYKELKSKYMNAVDMAYRLGVEEGMKQSQMDQANQQMADAQAQQQDAMAGGGDPNDPNSQPQNNNGAPGTPDQGNGVPDKSGAPSVQPAPVSENPEGSELDKHIETLESMINKSEDPTQALKDSLASLKSIRAHTKFNEEMKKSQMAIPAIAKAMHKPAFKFGVQANHNLSTNAKAAVGMQHRIVNDIMNKMAEEEQKASKSILSTLNLDGIVKG